MSLSVLDSEGPNIIVLYICSVKSVIQFMSVPLLCRHPHDIADEQERFTSGSERSTKSAEVIRPLSHSGKWHTYL